MKSLIYVAGQTAGFFSQEEVAQIGEKRLLEYEKQLGRELNMREKETFFDGFWKGVA